VISQQLRPIPLVTFANGSQWLPAFSPDGSRVAYSWQAETGWYLEVKDVGADTHLRLTPSPAGFPPGPTWSPDGRQIAYARAAASDNRGIFVISAIGGPEKKLRSLAPWRVPQRVVSWSPDGRWIAFADETRADSGATPSSRGPNAIYLISPETLETRQLTHPAPGDFGDSAPTFSPHGLTIAFVRTKADSHDEIYRIALDGSSPCPLVTEGLWTNGLAGLPMEHR
jgi:Tol biopolymer transport system component